MLNVSVPRVSVKDPRLPEIIPAQQYVSENNRQLIRCVYTDPTAWRALGMKELAAAVNPVEVTRAVSSLPRRSAAVCAERQGVPAETARMEADQ